MSARDTSYANPPAWRVGAAFVVMLALAGALVLVSRPGDDAAPAPPSVPLPAAGPATPDATMPAVSAVSQPDEPEILADVRAALGAWGEFAASGDLATVDTHFWPDGPQRIQLGREASAILDAPPGPPPYDFALGDPVVEVVSDAAVNVAGIVTVSRPGVDTATYEWRLEMRRDPESGRWLLWTVTTAS